MTDTVHDRTETMGTASASVPVSGAPQVGPGPICVHLRPSGRLQEAAPDKGSSDATVMRWAEWTRWGRLDERDPRHWIVRVGAGVASHGRAKRRAASRGRVTTWECLPRWRACRTLQLAARTHAPPRVWGYALLPQSCTWGGPSRPHRRSQGLAASQCWCSVLLARCGYSVRVSRTLDAQRRRAQGTSAALSW